MDKEKPWAGFNELFATGSGSLVNETTGLRLQKPEEIIPARPKTAEAAKKLDSRSMDEILRDGLRGWLDLPSLTTNG